MWTENFQMYKLDLEKAKEPEIKMPTSIGSLKKQERSRETSCFCFIDYFFTSAFFLFTVFLYFCFIDYAKALKRCEYRTTLPASWEICMQVKEQVRTGHGTKDWFQIGKGVCQGCILLIGYLTYMQSTSCKMLGWMKHKLVSRLLGEISTFLVDTLYQIEEFPLYSLFTKFVS